MSGEFAAEEPTRKSEAAGLLTGAYRIKAALASGGMATVYLGELVRGTGFQNTVAIKRIHAHSQHDSDAHRGVLDEANITARIINRDNICHVMDVGLAGGSPFIVMEYLHGEPFSEILRTAYDTGSDDPQPLPFWMACSVAHDAARGLHVAHTTFEQDGEGEGIIHRDISPQNIFVLYEGGTKLVDFGIAKATGRFQETQENKVKGKSRYMSPEQITGGWTDEDGNRHELGIQTDIWALGVVLWEALAGRRLFRGKDLTDVQVMYNVVNDEVPNLRDVNPEVPEDLAYIVDCALQKSPDNRYPSAELMADELESWLAKLDHPTGPAHVRRWMLTHFAERKQAKEDLIAGRKLEAASTLLKARLISGSEAMVLNEGIFSSTGGDPDATRAGVYGHEGHETGASFSDQSGVRDTSTGQDAIATIAVRRPVPGGDELSAPPAAPPRNWRPMATAALVVALGIGGLATVLAGGSDEATLGAAETATPPAALALQASAAPGIPDEPTATAAADQEQETIEEAALAPEPVDIAPTPADSRSAPRGRSGARAASSSPEALVAGPGKLRLVSTPVADAYLGGERIGRTPLIDHELPAGRHRIDLRTTDGRRETITVTVTSGETTPRRVNLQ